MTSGGIDAVRAAQAELDAVVEEIREVAGFTRFVAPPSFEEIAVVATKPLVYLAAAKFGGLAMIVRGEDVTQVRLDGLTEAAVRDVVDRHLRSYGVFRSAPLTGRATWSSALSELTRWLWAEAVGPVLARLGAETEVVFIAGGLLGLLPLHAAWTPDDTTPTGRRYALDQLAISYAPNARALLAGRELAAQVSGRRLLSVVDPAPVAAPPLPFAAVESSGFSAGVAAGSGSGVMELPGPAATPLRFLRMAREADLLHLACHGRADLDEPLDSALLLAGARVTLRRLLELDPPLRVRLAVLSACETALPGTDLPDEVIGLPTGLLQAGVAGVIASQWAVFDRATAMLMTEFAGRWAGGDNSPAAALRDAQRWLRDTTNADKQAHWLAAADNGAIPAAVATRFVEATAGGADVRGHEDLAAWAAFTHLGA